MWHRLHSAGCLAIAAAAVVAISPEARSAEQSPQQIAEAIDRHVDERLSEAEVRPAQPVGDPEFLRRVTLDLAGRVPTVAEWESFRKSSSPNKRAEVVQRLIDSPDFAYHQRNELDLMLLRRLEYNQGWREYLLEATRENRSWDQLFREVMLPEETCSDDKRPAAFLSKRLDDLDTVTNDSSILWFGVNVACAKCHDHPLVFDWTQAHYYGLASFFKRSYRTRSGFLGERFEGRLKYATITGEEHQAEFQFLTGKTVAAPEPEVEPEKLKEFQEAIKQAQREESAERPPQPEFQPRRELVRLALKDREAQFFAKNIVNRIWARLLGRGLVHPLDQMHSENPPSHPDLLQLMADDLTAHGYDLKRLVHAIVLTEVYARSMRYGEASEKPPADLFAVAAARPLSPHQLSLSWKVASSSPEHLLGLADPENWPEMRQRLEDQSAHVARQLAIPDDGFQVPVTEALWFNNNPAVRDDYLSGGSEKLVGYLKTIDDDQQLVVHATRSVLSRDPKPAERRAMTDYLAARADRRETGIRQVVWALMSSPEFRFNH